MTTPTPRDVHIDVALTNISIKYQNADLIAEKIFPVITVNKESNLYFIYGKQDFYIDNDIRAPGTRAKQVEWKIEGTGQYLVREHAYETQIPIEVKENADEPLNIEVDTTEFLTNKIKLNLEKNVADIIQNPNNYANGHSSSPSVKWDNYANSDPLQDILVARKKVRDAIFRKPNTLIMSEDVFLVLRRHPKLLEMYKYTSGGQLTVDILKELFEVDNLLIGVAGYNAATEGATENLQPIWQDSVAYLYVTPTPGLKQLTFGYIFRMKGFPMVEKWDDRPTNSEWIRVRDKYDVKVVSPVAGYLLTNVLSY